MVDPITIAGVASAAVPLIKTGVQVGAQGYYGLLDAYQKAPALRSLSVLSQGAVYTILNPLAWLVVIVGTIIFGIITLLVLRRVNPCFLRNVQSKDPNFKECDGKDSISGWRLFWVSFLPVFIIMLLIVAGLGLLIAYATDKLGVNVFKSIAGVIGGVGK